MDINAASEYIGLSKDTLRYYERLGLIPPVARRSNGYREYSEEDLNWLYFAKVMRNAGFSIDRLLTYVTLVKAGDDTVEARRQLLVEQLHTLDAQLSDLKVARDYLAYKVETYDTQLSRFEAERLTHSLAHKEDSE